MSQLMTNSRLAALRRCPRYHHIRYNLGYRSPETDEALAFGSLFHKGLENWWLWSLEDAVNAMREEKTDPFQLAKAEVLLCGYDIMWEKESGCFEALEIESEFRGPLVPGWDMGGKLDGIVRAQDGKILLLEHKTTSLDIDPGSDYWKRLKLDGQVSLYYQGAKAMGYTVDGCLYDVIRKPALRPKKDETPEAYGGRIAAEIQLQPEKYYRRGIVVRLEQEMRDAMSDVAATTALANMTYRNPESCVSYGRTCQYFSVCSGEASLEDGHFVKLDNVHPELEKQS